MIYNHAKQAWQFDAYTTKVHRMVAMCGIKMTALYLRNRGYTPEQAIILMFK